MRRLAESVTTLSLTLLCSGLIVAVLFILGRVPIRNVVIIAAPFLFLTATFAVFGLLSLRLTDKDPR